MGSPTPRRRSSRLNASRVCGRSGAASGARARAGCTAPMPPRTWKASSAPIPARGRRTTPSFGLVHTFVRRLTSPRARSSGPGPRPALAPSPGRGGAGPHGTARRRRSRFPPVVAAREQSGLPIEDHEAEATVLHASGPLAREPGAHARYSGRVRMRAAAGVSWRQAPAPALGRLNREREQPGIMVIDDTNALRH